MSKPQLEVVAGALPRGTRKARASLEEAIVKRRRAETARERPTDDSGTADVIPLLQGWIRRLERESASAAQKRH